MNPRVNSTGAAAGVAIASSSADYSGTTNYSKPGILNRTCITLTAPAASGGRNFSDWSGCDSTNPAARTCTLSIASDRTVTVNYVAAPAEPRVLKVRSSGTICVPILGSPSRYSGRTDYYRKNIPDGGQSSP
uniref:hypothetical protein n=1 Tax=Candidatus Electronema sp. TaxID=2698783 RepID=UPI0040569389